MLLTKETIFVLKVGTKVRTIKFYRDGGVSIHIKTMFKSFAISAKNIEEAKIKMEKQLTVFFRCNYTEIIRAYRNIECEENIHLLDSEKDKRPIDFMKWAEEITANI